MWGRPEGLMGEHNDFLTHLIAPEPVLVVRSERVDDNRDGQRQNEDAAQGAEAT